MASNAFEFAVPAPHAASFTNNEKAVSVASPLASAAPRTVFFLSRWFDFEGGTYTLKIVADDAVTAYEGSTMSNTKTIGSTTINAGVVNLAAYIPRGRRRLDFVLTNLSTSASSCYVAFSLWLGNKIVYSSSAAGWVYSTTPIPDAELASTVDEVLTYPVFSVLPDWRNGILERLEYSTDVLDSETDTEQRRSIRRYPRRSVEASFVDIELKRARLHNFFSGSMNRKVLVPLWFEQYKIKSTLTASLVFPTGSLAMRDFAAGQYVIVQDKDPGLYEILKIQSVNSTTDTLTFTSAPVKTWSAGCRVMPLRVAYIREMPSMDHMTDRAATVSVRFFLDEPCKFPAGSWGYCTPLFRFKFNRAAQLPVTYDQAVFVIDNTTGRIDVTDPGQRTRIITRAPLTIFGREQLFAFRQFVSESRGRLSRFWFPSLTADIHPLSDFSGEVFEAKNTGAAEYMRTQQETRQMLAIVFRDKRPEVYRRITNIEQTPTSELYYLDRPLGSITLADVERVMLVHPVRFDQDAFEIRHIVDDGKASSTSVVVRSVNVDDMPDIDCSVTSRPYPLFNMDEMAPTLTLVSASLTVFGYPAEEMNVSMTIPSASLQSLLVSYGNWPAESLDTAAPQIISGTLVNGIDVIDNWPAESLDTSLTLPSGSLVNGLISYTNALAESLDVSVSITGATLA